MNNALQNAQVDDLLPTLTLAAVDRVTLALFGCASGDLNPIHLDVDFARKAGMPDVFAHGMLSMAWLGRLLTNWAPQSRLRSFGVRFQGLTHLGNVITCQGRVSEIVEVNGERCARVEVSTSNQYGQIKIVGDALIAIAIG
ncbi:MaoC family dehydratase [Pseudomonas sp. GM17]|uniref:MaoC family dehydratase n=1 Tax=Pseudomonas sp. GM17 TaxID=1144323 RepID=UPI000272506D|nr:MaoC family dehydratase [Pseudomonas sp. GM17]WIE48437.1 MaoC family dehydratase [Pseudomonas sp. GM17]